MPHTLNDVKKLVIVAGVFLMLCAVVGLAKAGIPSRTLITCSPLFWLAGIIICGLFLRLCDAIKESSPRPVHLARFPEREWDSNLAASELGVFIGPQTISMRSAGASRLSLAHESILRSLTRKSSLPRYDELLPPLPCVITNADTGNEMNEHNGNTNEYEFSEPPSYSEAMSLCRLHDLKKNECVNEPK